MRQRIVLAWRAAKVAPLRAKIVLVVVALYLLSPIDIIPDFIPVLGQLDDILVVGLAMGYLSRVAPDVVAALKKPEPEEPEPFVSRFRENPNSTGGFNND